MRFVSLIVRCQTIITCYRNQLMSNARANTGNEGIGKKVLKKSGTEDYEFGILTQPRGKSWSTEVVFDHHVVTKNLLAKRSTHKLIIDSLTGII